MRVGVSLCVCIARCVVVCKGILFINYFFPVSVLIGTRHGDTLVIADANFSSDQIAQSATVKQVIRVSGRTIDILRNLLTLFPLDTYSETPVIMMDLVNSDKLKVSQVEAYSQAEEISGVHVFKMERFMFYEAAKQAFCVVQTDDRSPYANVLISKGVL